MSMMRVDGIDLNVELQGNGHPLILIHGIGMDNTRWKYEIARLNQFCKTVALDCRGHGKSEFSLNAITQLNERAKYCGWAHQLKRDGTYSDVFQSGTLAGIIASICVMELAKSDVTRIKICCRTSCGLYFYDTTRNRSARWHAENPCGWRTRSERRK